MACLHYFGNICVISLEELGRIDGCVGNGPLRYIGGGLDVGEEEADGVRWLRGQDGQQSEELGRVMVRQVSEDEAFGVVFMDAVCN